MKQANSIFGKISFNNSTNSSILLKQGYSEALELSPNINGTSFPYLFDKSEEIKTAALAYAQNKNHRELISTKKVRLPSISTRDKVVSRSNSIFEGISGLGAQRSSIGLDPLIGQGHLSLKMDKTSLSHKRRLHLFDPRYSGRREDHEVDVTGREKHSTYAYTLFRENDGTYKWERCKILDILEEGLYVVKFDDAEITKAVDRLNLRMDWETEEDFNSRRNIAFQERYKHLYFETLKDNIGKEQLSNVRVLLPRETLAHILNKASSDRHNKPAIVKEFMNELDQIQKDYHYSIHEFAYLFGINHNSISQLEEWFERNKRETIGYTSYKNKTLILNIISEIESGDSTKIAFEVYSKVPMIENESFSWKNYVAEQESNLDLKESLKSAHSTVRWFVKSNQAICKFDPNRGIPINAQSLVSTLKTLFESRKYSFLESIKWEMKQLIVSKFIEDFDDYYFEKYRHAFLNGNSETYKDNLRTQKALISHLNFVNNPVEQLVIERLNKLRHPKYSILLRKLWRSGISIIASERLNVIQKITDTALVALQDYSLNAPIPFLLDGKKSTIKSLVEPEYLEMAQEAINRLYINEATCDFEMDATTRVYNEAFFESNRVMFKECVAVLVRHNFNFPEFKKVQKRLDLTYFEIDFTLNSSEKTNPRLRRNIANQKQLCREFILSVSKGSSKALDQAMLVMMQGYKEPKIEPPKETYIESLCHSFFKRDRLFDWLSYKNLLLVPKSSFTNSIKEITNMALLHLSESSNLDILDFKDFQFSQEDYRASFQQRYYSDYIKVYLRVLKYSLLGLFSLIFILDNFCYLFLDKKIVIRSLLEIDKKKVPLIEFNENLKVEIQHLLKDRDLIRLSFKDEFIFGFLKTNIGWFKTQAIQRIDDLLDYFTHRATKMAFKSFQEFKEINDRLKGQIKLKPGSIDEFIRIKKRVNSEDFKEEQKSSRLLHGYTKGLLSRLMLLKKGFNNKIVFLEIDMRLNFEFVENQCAILGESLKVSKFDFYDEIVLHVKEIDTEFAEINDQLLMYYDISAFEDAKACATNALNLYNYVIELFEKSKRVQFYQKELGMKVTSFDSISQKASEFKHFVDLWQFYVKWEMAENRWLNNRVIVLKAADISSLLYEGKKLISYLTDYFADLATPMQLTIEMSSRINTFERDYMEILLIITHESFTSKYWDLLIANIWHSNMSEVPRIEILTFKMLVDKDLYSHKSYVMILHQKAISEYNVSRRIKDLAKEVSDIPIRPHYLGKSENISVIPNIGKTLERIMGLKFEIKSLLENFNQIEQFEGEIFSLLREIELGEMAFNRFLILQNLMFENWNLFRYFKDSDFFETAHISTASEVESVYASWIDNARAAGFKFFINLGKQIVATSPSVKDVVTKYINFVKDIISKGIQDVIDESRRGSPRLYLATKEEIKSAISEIAIPTGNTNFLGSIFPELHQFEIENKTAIVAVVLKDGTRLQLENMDSFLSNSKPLPILIGLIKQLEKGLEKTLQSQPSWIIHYLYLNSYEYERLFYHPEFRKTSRQVLFVTLRAIFFAELSFFLTHSQNHPESDIKIADHLKRYRMSFISSIKKLAFITFNDVVARISDRAQEICLLDSYILCLKEFEQFIDFLISNDAMSLDSYEWISTPKVSIVIPYESLEAHFEPKTYLDDVSNVIDLSFKQRNLMPNVVRYSKLDTFFESEILGLNVHYFDYMQSYGFKAVNSPENLVDFALGDKVKINLYMTLSKGEFPVIKGTSRSGKRSTIMLAASYIGRFLVEWEMGMPSHSAQLLDRIVGSLSTGHWCLLKGIQSQTSELMSVLGCFILEVKNCLRDKRLDIVSLGNRFKYSIGSTVLLTWNLSENSKAEIPWSIKDAFRCCSILKYDFYEFSRIYLADLVYFDKYGQGFLDDICSKLILFFQMLKCELDNKVFMTFKMKTLYEIDQHLCEYTIAELNYSNLANFLQRLKLELRIQYQQESVPVTILKILYADYTSSMTKSQSLAFVLLFNSVFNQGDRVFEVSDLASKSFIDEVCKFYAMNQIPDIIPHSTVEKMERLTEIPERKVCLIYGNFKPTEDHYKLMLFSHNYKQEKPKKLVLFNMGILGEDQLLGDPRTGFQGQLSLLLNRSYYMPIPNNKKQWFSVKSSKFHVFFQERRMQIESGVREVNFEQNDLIVLSDSGDQNLNIIPKLVVALSQGSLLTLTGKIELEANQKIIVIREELRNADPTHFSGCQLTYLNELEIERNYISKKLEISLKWGSFWISELIKIIEQIERYMISPIIDFIKYLSSSDLLIFFPGQKIMFESMYIKIEASISLLDHLFEFHKKEEEPDKEEADSAKIFFKAFIECVSMMCIISEIDIYVKNQAKLRASQFIVELLESLKYKAESLKKSKDKTPITIQRMSIVSYDSDFALGLSTVISKLKSNETIFDIFYSHLEHKWLRWSNIQLEPISCLASSSFRTYIKERYSMRFNRDNSQSYSSVLNEATRLTHTLTTPGISHIQSLMIPSLNKSKYWAMLLFSYGKNFTLLSENQLSKQMLIDEVIQAHSLSEDQFIRFNSACLNNENALDKFFLKQLMQRDRPIVKYFSLNLLENRNRRSSFRDSIFEENSFHDRGSSGEQYLL